MCVHWLVEEERRVNGRDDTVRFTDLNSLQELASMKLDEQPISVLFSYYKKNGIIILW